MFLARGRVHGYGSAIRRIVKPYPSKDMQGDTRLGIASGSTDDPISLLKNIRLCDKILLKEGFYEVLR
jgi:hypothetical protein